MQDEVTVASDTTITWGITTDAEIEVTSPGVTRLTQEGKSLSVRILTPNAEFAQKDAPQPDPPYYGNEGVRRLETTVKASGPVTIAVQFSPEWED